MIRQEYIRFLHTLDSTTNSKAVRKVANLVLDNIDTLRPLSTHQGQRIKKLVELAQAQWQVVSEDVNATLESSETDGVPMARLTSMRVGPFRGFARPEHFDLDSKLVIVYGPNGSGKTSFCEALEFGLLGMVVEAEGKRINPPDYFKNAYINSYEKPNLEASTPEGVSRSVIADESRYRYCFVEKNRIDNFSRIAAQLPAKQTELISSLFGLDSFNKFVGNFTSDIDERYIDLIGRKRQELIKKQQKISSEQELVRKNNEALMTLSNEESNLAHSYHKDTTFTALAVLLGNEESPGLIALYEAGLKKLPPKKSGVNISDLFDKKILIEQLLKEKSTIEIQLSELSTEISFKKLYSAIIELEGLNSDQCPACKTPIDKTYSNPYLLADEELVKLSNLSDLETKFGHVNSDINDAIHSVYEIIRKTHEHRKEEWLGKLILEKESLVGVDWWDHLFTLDAVGSSIWNNIVAGVRDLVKGDIEIDRSIRQRERDQSKLDELRKLERKVIDLKGRRQSFEEGIRGSKAKILDFNQSNKRLIEAADDEKSIVQQNIEISDAYAIFVKRLSKYKDSLPGKLVADLSRIIVDLYNAFNRRDSPKDLLASIKLPLASGQKIEVAFQTNPKKYYDALHILSEGHVRCLGLAILLAKNLKEDCPVLIFDDPVNAIDDDHRESIRKTLFEDKFFESKQIILTCHGEEFFKDIQNQIGSKNASLVKKFTFLPQFDEHHIVIDFHCGPRNYILAAKEHIRKLEVREALSKSRQALEYLTKNKVWGYLHRYGEGQLKLSIRSPSPSIELRNLTEQLKSKISNEKFQHENKSRVLAPLGTLLGIDGSSREWRYLNKGVHEEVDRSEFDRDVVKDIVAALEALDESLS